MVNGKWQAERVPGDRVRNYCHFSGGRGWQRLRTYRDEHPGIPGNPNISRRQSACSRCGMAKSKDLRVRGFEFTVDIVRLCRADLSSGPIIRRLAYQLVDAAGSVGANLEESGAGQTKPDFIAKQCIALKEAKESRFWIRVIAEAYPTKAQILAPRLQESTELVAMLTASIKTARSNPHRGENGQC